MPRIVLGRRYGQFKELTCASYRRIELPSRHTREPATPGPSAAIEFKQIDDEGTKRDALETALFGVDRYAACIVCGRVVLPPWSPQYRLKWDTLQEQLVDEGTRPLRVAWVNGILAAQGGETFSVCALPVGAEPDA
jgi:hypothetical protein